MKTYLIFIIKKFLTSFFYVLSIIFCLGFILNYISELDFFRDIEITTYLPLYLSLLDTPILIFEIFPFIFLISTQLFFTKLFTNDEINIFKYSGLKNSKIVAIISILSFVMGFIIITLFYNFSSNLKNFYLNIKSDFTNDGKYLAVVTKNGLWIKDVIDENNIIINAEKIDNNELINAYISIFDIDFNNLRNINASKIDVSQKNWVIKNANVLEQNKNFDLEQLNIMTNYDIEIIQNLFSNLTSLSIFDLLTLRANYLKLNYSLIEIDIQLLKLIFYPLYLILMVLLGTIIMMNSKNLKNNVIRYSIGLFFSVLIYYTNNLFLVLGQTEKINLLMSISIPMTILLTFNLLMLKNINDK